MTTTTASTTPSPATAEPVGKLDLARHRWIGRVLVCAGGLTLLADWLLYDLNPGIAWSLFFAFLWAAIVWNRDLSAFRDRWQDKAVGVAMLLTLMQFAWRASFSSGLCLVLLSVYLAGHLLYRGQHPWWRRFIEQAVALLSSPFRWAQGSYWVSMGGWKSQSHERTSRKAGVLTARWIGIVAPSAVLALFFLFLLGKGNAILGEALNEGLESFYAGLMEIQFPSFTRIFFWGFVATLVLGLLWRSTHSRSLGWLDKLCDRRGETLSATLSDPFVGIWRTRLLLIVVNLIFFAANSIDISYLWSDLELPRGMTLSKFVHSGTYSLIASVILAAVVISVLFQQPPAITKARGQRLLAMFWVVQNLLLLGNVFLRVKMYVDQYQLSALRVHLGLFLMLVAVGFVLLGIRVVKNRRFSWLAGANMLAVFLLFFVVQFWNTRAFVANYNVERAIEEPGRELDLAYLDQLGPGAWTALAAIANGDHPGLSRFEDQAAGLLARIRSREEHVMAGEHWQEYQGYVSRQRRMLSAGMAAR